MTITRLAVRSLFNRRFTVILTVCSIAMSVALLLGVEKIRRDAKSSFANTLSGTDLIVGARSGSIQLLLYSVFRIGNASNNITWESYQELAAHPEVKWTIPLSLGDSHRGFRVLGTESSYFEHYRYGGERRLGFSAGEPFTDLYEAVIGAEVSEQLAYRLNQEIIVSHGLGDVSFSDHRDKPFRISGILNRTGTPVDRTVHVSLAGIEAMHIDWQSGARLPGISVSAEQARQMNLTPRAITAFLVGLESKLSIFRVQRSINEYREEPLLAILPGVALQELWDLMSVAETALLIISVFVVIAGLTGMLTVILASLNERRREMAILRSVGAKPRHIFGLLVLEAGLLALLGVVLGLVLFYGVLLMGQPFIESRFGLFVPLSFPGLKDWMLLAAIIGAGFIVGLIPALRAYRYSLADGLTIRL